MQEDKIAKDINAYKKLRKISKSQELDEFMDLLITTAASKMLYAFIGKNVKNWEEFLEVRAEVTSYLYPIQEVYGANAMIKRLEENLQEYKNIDNA